MSTSYVNKVVYGNETLIDLTSDTVDAAHVLSGATFHDKSGAPVTGSCTYDSNTQSDNVAVAEILYGKTAHARGTQLTGTMPNIGAATGTISSKNDSYSIAQGYHDGSGTVAISSTEKAKLIAENIRSGITLLGVEGSMSGSEDEVPQQKTVTPSSSQQTILPDTNDGYTCLSQVTVNAIPYTESSNSAGGLTVTIG